MIFKILGRLLSTEEKMNINGGGTKVHGACNNGAHFSFAFSVDTYQQSLAQIRSTICAGRGISYMDALPMQ